MCQIILYKSEKSKMESFDFNNICNMLKDKGGDSLGIAHAGIDNHIISKQFESQTFREKLEELKLYIERVKPNTLFMIFSRQTPALEIESSDAEILHQPYINDKENCAVCVHGTIPNANRIDPKAIIDTDIFKRYEFDYISNKAQGSFVAVKLFVDGFNIVNKGGLGVFVIKNSPNKFILSMSPSDDNLFDSKFISDNLIGITSKIIETEQMFTLIPMLEEVRNPLTVVLCSGGLDSYCAAIKAMHRNPNQKMHLVYIAYGTRAQEKEIESVYRLQTFLNLIAPQKVEVIVIEASQLFESYFVALGRKLSTFSLLNQNSKGGGIEEAEQGSAYIPLRNTFMVNLIAGRYEQSHPDAHVDIVLGLNLDDGMAANMLDNTNGWLYLINQTVKLSGARTKRFSVSAPYVNKTKLNMLLDVQRCKFSSNDTITSDVIVDLLEQSFSCYYPDKHNKPCGECGSCHLRRSAFNRYKNKNKKEK